MEQNILLLGSAHVIDFVWPFALLGIDTWQDHLIPSQTQCTRITVLDPAPSPIFVIFFLELMTNT